MARFVFLDVYLLFSFVALLSFLFGFFNFLSKYDENNCEMTYMYEYPQFVRISLPTNISASYKRYALYAYAEGRFIEKTRQMKFDGIPVLFIPGHSGSFKQVRSMASVSLRKALGSRTPFHFDYFTTDLNEEYSGLFGGVLKDQTRFVHYAIQRIFTLYKKNIPDSIILVGHSMGGILAKGLFLEPDFDKNRVRLVITLATPHTPVVLLDKMAASYYHNVAPNWSYIKAVTMISVGGGPKDLVVRSGLTLTKEADINVLSTGVPGVWISTDHLCILWCKQLVIVLVRALFDSVDLQTLQISQDQDLVKNVFQYHLVDRSAGKRYATSQHPSQVVLWNGKSHPGDWVESLGKRVSVMKPMGVPRTTYYMIRIMEQYKGEMLAISAYNHKGKDWIFACSANAVVTDMRVCEEGENLSHLGRISPTKTFKHKVAYLNLTSISSQGHKFVIIKIPFTNQPVEVHYDIHPYHQRVITPKNLWILPYKTQIVNETEVRALRYTIKLPDFVYMWQAFRLHLLARNCTSESHQAVATFNVPWSNENTSALLRTKNYLNVPLLLQNSEPPGWTGGPAAVHLYLDPACTYSVVIQSSPLDSLGEIVRVHSTELISYMAAISLLTIKYQLEMLSTQQHCVMFYVALVEGAKPYFILPLIKIASKLIGSSLSATGMKAYIPMPDQNYMQDNGTDFLLLPVLLYSVAFALMFVSGFGIYIGIVFSGQTVNKFITNFVVTRLVGFRTWSKGLLELAHRVPFCVAMFTMLTLQYTACGGLVLIFGTIFYFLKVCSMYEDCLEHLWMTPFRLLKKKLMSTYSNRGTTQVQKPEEDEEDVLDINRLTTGLNFHLTLLILWAIASVAHIPSVLVWAHNYKYDSFLKHDPAFNIGFVMCLVGTALWLVDTPFVGSSMDMYSECGNLISAFVVLVMLYTPVSLHNLPTLLTGSFAVIASHQLYLYSLWQSQIRQELTEAVPLLIPIEDTSKETSENDTESGEEKSADENDKLSNKTDEESNEDSDNVTQSELGSRKNSISELSLSSSYEAVSISESANKKSD